MMEQLLRKPFYWVIKASSNQWPSLTTIGYSSSSLWTFPIAFTEYILNFNATSQAMVISNQTIHCYTQCNWVGMRIETLDKGYLTSRTPNWINEGNVTISALVLGI